MKDLKNTTLFDLNQILPMKEEAWAFTIGCQEHSPVASNGLTTMEIDCRPLRATDKLLSGITGQYLYAEDGTRVGRIVEYEILDENTANLGLELYVTVLDFPANFWFFGP